MNSFPRSGNMSKRRLEFPLTRNVSKIVRRKENLECLNTYFNKTPEAVLYNFRTISLYFRLIP